MPLVTRNIRYVPPGYDPTNQEWPIPGVRLRYIVAVFGIVLVIGGMVAIGLSMFYNSQHMPPLPTVYQPTNSAEKALEATATLYIYTLPTKPPDDIAKALGGLNIGTKYPTATFQPSKTPAPIKTRLATKRAPAIRATARPSCNPDDRPLCSDEKPWCCGVYQP